MNSTGNKEITQGNGEVKMEGDIKVENKEGTPNPLKRKRKRGRKRCRPHKLSRRPNDPEHTLMKNQPPSPSSEDIEYCLMISNFPDSWHFMDIKNYIDAECGPVDEMELVKEDDTSNNAIRLTYETEEQCRTILEKLKNKEINGKKLTLEMIIETIESDTESSPENNENARYNKQWNPEFDEWEIDPKGVYGLKTSFLKSLNITPPIDKWVHVSNFRCDKSELRDVMELAGKVLLCSVITITHKYASVMYSHPLEAVQAVSMLNGQVFYGQVLKVAMDHSLSNGGMLPKGLSGVGRGLGVGGKPLRDVERHYRRHLGRQRSQLDLAHFDGPPAPPARPPPPPPAAGTRTTGTNTAGPGPAALRAAAAWGVGSPPPPPPGAPPEPRAPPIPRAPGPRPPGGQGAHFSMARGLHPAMVRGPHLGMAPGPHPGMAPGQRPLMLGAPRPPQAPSPDGPLAGPPPSHAPGPRPIMGPGPRAALRPLMPQTGWEAARGPGPMPAHSVPQPVQLRISNLPPTMSFCAVCELVARAGQVVGIQLTLPGCASVTYSNRTQADSFFALCNGMVLEGHVVHVAYA